MVDDTKIEVLVTTMHRDDGFFIREMNLPCKAVVANQADVVSYEEFECMGILNRMITTQTRGLSRNRNIAIFMSEAEFVMFSDDDMIFRSESMEIIKEEFKRFPEADAIKFGVKSRNPKRELSYRPPKRTKIAKIREITSAGVVALVIKKSVIEKKSLYFDNRFGAGTDLFCGEDTIFLIQLLRLGCRVYLSEYTIAEVKQENSSWNEGHTAKYFRTVGTVLGNIYPILSFPISVRGAFRFSRREPEGLPFLQILKEYLAGIRDGRKL